MIHRAIAKTGRPIVLSLSPGPTSPGIAKDLMPLAQMWRISDDVWDFWQNPKPWPRSVYGQFELIAGWSPIAKAGTWPDADMLPVGYLGPHPGEGDARESRLTHDEQQTLLTLWSIGRSPLVLGANLTKLDDWTTKLLTNREVLAVDQHGRNQRQVAIQGDTIVWTSDGPGTTKYLAVFNRTDTNEQVHRTYQFYNLPAARYRSRELWTRKEGGASDTLDVTVPPHGCMLFALTPAP
jgi:hypothetical protein